MGKLLRMKKLLYQLFTANLHYLFMLIGIILIPISFAMERFGYANSDLLGTYGVLISVLAFIVSLLIEQKAGKTLRELRDNAHISGPVFETFQSLMTDWLFPHLDTIDTSKRTAEQPKLHLLVSTPAVGYLAAGEEPFTDGFTIHELFREKLERFVKYGKADLLFFSVGTHFPMWLNLGIAEGSRRYDCREHLRRLANRKRLGSGKADETVFEWPFRVELSDDEKSLLKGRATLRGFAKAITSMRKLVQEGQSNTSVWLTTGDTIRLIHVRYQDKINAAYLFRAKHETIEKSLYHVGAQDDYSLKLSNIEIKNYFLPMPSVAIRTFFDGEKSCFSDMKECPYTARLQRPDTGGFSEHRDFHSTKSVRRKLTNDEIMYLFSDYVLGRTGRTRLDYTSFRDSLEVPSGDDEVQQIEREFIPRCFEILVVFFDYFEDVPGGLQLYSANITPGQLVRVCASMSILELAFKKIEIQGLVKSFHPGIQELRQKFESIRLNIQTQGPAYLVDVQKAFEEQAKVLFENESPYLNFALTRKVEDDSKRFHELASKYTPNIGKLMQDPKQWMDWHLEFIKHKFSTVHFDKPCMEVIERKVLARRLHHIEGDLKSAFSHLKEIQYTQIHRQDSPGLEESNLRAAAKILRLGLYTLVNCGRHESVYKLYRRWLWAHDQAQNEYPRGDKGNFNQKHGAIVSREEKANLEEVAVPPTAGASPDLSTSAKSVEIPRQLHTFGDNIQKGNPGGSPRTGYD